MRVRSLSGCGWGRIMWSEREGLEAGQGYDGNPVEGFTAEDAEALASIIRREGSR